MTLITTIALAYWAVTAGIVLAFMRLREARPRPLYVVAVALWPLTALLGLLAVAITRVAGLLRPRPA